MKNDKGIKGTIDEVERVAYSILNDTLKLTKIFGKMKIFRTWFSPWTWCEDFVTKFKERKWQEKGKGGKNLLFEREQNNRMKK